ncbi:MAG: hypothetical protein ACKPFK_00070, partial [Dolichospermum sp.]
VAILLIPQNKKETTVSGEAVFSYSGLLQIMEIKVLSKQWSGVPVSWQKKHSERSVAPKY